MKKIPTLFKREFKNHQIIKVLPEVTPGCEFVLEGMGIATEKFDGSCCAIIDGVFYKRFDAKKGRKIPKGAIPCCEPDPVTGHHPHWVPIDENNPDDKWFIEARKNTAGVFITGRCTTFEAVGNHFNGNPYRMKDDRLIRHGSLVIRDVPRTF